MNHTAKGHRDSILHVLATATNRQTLNEGFARYGMEIKPHSSGLVVADRHNQRHTVRASAIARGLSLKNLRAYSNEAARRTVCGLGASSKLIYDYHTTICNNKKKNIFSVYYINQGTNSFCGFKATIWDVVGQPFLVHPRYFWRRAGLASCDRSHFI